MYGSRDQSLPLLLTYMRRGGGNSLLNIIKTLCIASALRSSQNRIDRNSIALAEVSILGKWDVEHF